MNILIDTHYLVWSVFETKKLKPRVKSYLEDRSNTVIVSTVSLWEISLKYGSGKLKINDSLFYEKILKSIEKQSYQILELNLIDSLSFYKLGEFKHKDPFDRMLIWQAIQNEYRFLTVDEELDQYENIGLKII